MKTHAKLLRMNVFSGVAALLICMTLFFIPVPTAHGQATTTIAVSEFDPQGIAMTPGELGNLFRLEMEKKDSFSVIDRYDMAEFLSAVDMDITNCYGKTCLVEIGKALQVDKVLSGSVERYGEKIVITLRLVDVKKETIEKTNVTEYLDLQEELQIMAMMSVNNILGLENEKHLVDLLVNYEEPITSKYASQRLNGPRMGVAYVTGDLKQGLVAPEEQGGYGGYPVLSQFGYQYELQYVSAKNFSALVEFLGVVSGMEQQLFIPTLVFMNGFRFGDGNWEFAFGPSISIRKDAKGFYDTQGLLGEEGSWHLASEWPWSSDNPNPYEIVERYDSRGSAKINPGWIWAIGRTFHSGPLNIPVNVYCSPERKGWYIGCSIGFNINRKTSSMK